jgi:hypothetical protein
MVASTGTTKVGDSDNSFCWRQLRSNDDGCGGAQPAVLAVVERGCIAIQPRAASARCHHALLADDGRA